VFFSIRSKLFVGSVVLHFPRMPLRPIKERIVMGSGVLVWLLVVGIGFWTLTARSFVPGISGNPKLAWPEASGLQRNVGGYTLVVVLHPECPCSQATLEELDSIVAQCSSRLAVRVICMQYDDMAEPIERSRIWLRAKRISGVTVVKDMHSEKVRQFDAETSGETRLYGPGGGLLFRGGITASRGHVGDNPGQEAIIDFVTRGVRAGAPIVTPVFGCSL
jgi:hypothetical protein